MSATQAGSTSAGYFVHLVPRRARMSSTESSILATVVTSRQTYQSSDGTRLTPCRAGGRRWAGPRCASVGPVGVFCCPFLAVCASDCDNQTFLVVTTCRRHHGESGLGYSHHARHRRNADHLRRVG